MSKISGLSCVKLSTFRRWVLLVCALVVGVLPVSQSPAEEDRALPGDGDSPETNIGAIVSLQGEINDITVESLTRRVDEARAKGATTVIFDIDTPGGLVSAATEITDMIKSQLGMTTVAWVNTNAHSAGSMISVACTEIVMARSSRIGDSQVIFFGPDGPSAIPEDLQAKANTPVLHEFRASARLRGYDQVLSEAFVLPDREVWWIENIESGEREFVFRDEKLRRIDGVVNDKVTKKSKKKSKKSSDEDEDDEDDDDTDEDEREAVVVPDFEPEWKLVEIYYDPILDAETDVLQPVVRDDQLLEMSAGEAYAFGFSKAVVSSEQELIARYNLSKVIRFDRSWSESLALWLTSVYVRGFLMFIIMLGAYVEFHTPGVGVAGFVAVIALAIFVGAPYMTGLANVWEILFVAIGIGLLMLEVFVIPGFGVAGVGGFLFVAIGMLSTFAPDEPGRTIPLYIPTLDSTIEAIKSGVITMMSAFAASLVAMVGLSRVLPQTTFFRAIVPENPMPSEVAPDDHYRGAAMIGDHGVARTDLRPAGKAAFGTVLVDVISRGEFVESETKVEVIQRRGNVVVVRAIRSESDS